MLEILLRVADQAASHRDVAVAFGTEHTVDDVAQAIASHLGRPVSDGQVLRLGCQRLARPACGSSFMADSGLVSGDEVELSAVDATGVAPVVPAPVSGLTCDVVNGAGTGRSLPLHRGRYLIGRDSRADLALADPTVSSRHAIVTVSSSGAVTVEPAGHVTNPVIVDGRRIEAAVNVTDGSVIRIGGCALAVRHVRMPAGATRDRLGRVPFNRTPYRRPLVSETQVPGPGRPPAKPARRSANLLTVMLPMAGAIIFAWVLGRPEFLLFALLGPVSAVANVISERRHGGRTYREDLEVFNRRRSDWIERLDAAITDERRRRNDGAPDIADLARRAEQRTNDLWPRTRSSGDFLQLRVGLGDDVAMTTTELAEATEGDTFTTDLSEELRERTALGSVPIVLDAAGQAVVALHGEARAVAGASAAMLAQAAVLHSPEDLVVCAATARRGGIADALKWLPHTRSAASPIDADHVVVGTDAADDLVRRVVALARDRTARTWPHILLLLDEQVAVEGPTLSPLLEAAPDMGLTVVWTGHDLDLIPRQAMAVIECPPAESGRRARLWFTDPELDVRHVDPDLLELDALDRVARALAPVRDASGSSTTNAIPRAAPLLEVLGTKTCDPAWVVERWQSASPYSLRAPIGVGPHGPLEIDLVEHGPHALIAGTSGAGKSELLQSMIAALVTRYPPTRLNLLFIDYKGGASSDVFQDTPHSVGHVTNLGADLAMRALVSLRAELDRRMRLMEGRAKDLAEMLERHPREAPASLVIVVDEFATLVKEIPDFVTGMVDIAQRGRSLGIHLVLATQRPSGAVNDNILANTNLRISLRVLDAADSSSILGSGEAAVIPSPLRGRGFARLGPGGLVEFQSAFSGAPFTSSTGVAPVTVEDFLPTGGVSTVPAAPTGEEGARSQLDVVIAGVLGATQQLGLERGRRPWLEDLPASIALSEVLAGAFGAVGDRLPGRDVVVGIADEPERQRQRPHVVDLEASGGILVFGTGGSGRTTTLRTMVGSAVGAATPAEVEVYVLDYGGRSLEAMRDLPHVAAVATSDDLEQTTRILMHLHAEIARRQQLLAAHRAENVTALQRIVPSLPVPRIIVIVDGYDAFDRTFERGELYIWSEWMIETVLAGRAVGIHLIASADRRASVPAGLSNAVGGRIILRMADADALLDLGITSPVARDARLGNGRALLADGTTVQVAVVSDDVTSAGQVAALESLASATGSGLRAELPELPDEVARESLGASTSPMEFVLGVADLTLERVVCDVRTQHLAVVGPGESGRSTALATAAAGLSSNGRGVWTLCERDSPLASVDGHHVATGPDEYGELIDDLAASLAAGAAGGGVRPVLVVDAVERVTDDLGLRLEMLLRDDRVRVLAGFDGATLSGYAGGWLASLKATRCRLLLQPDDLGDLGALTPVRIRLRPGQRFPAGRGVFIANRQWSLVQVAR